jgi:hypothetical protein
MAAVRFAEHELSASSPLKSLGGGTIGFNLRHF